MIKGLHRLNYATSSEMKSMLKDAGKINDEAEKLCDQLQKSCDIFASIGSC